MLKEYYKYVPLFGPLFFCIKKFFKIYSNEIEWYDDLFFYKSDLWHIKRLNLRGWIYGRALNLLSAFWRFCSWPESINFETQRTWYTKIRFWTQLKKISQLIMVFMFNTILISIISDFYWSIATQGFSIFKNSKKCLF